MQPEEWILFSEGADEFFGGDERFVEPYECSAIRAAVRCRDDAGRMGVPPIGMERLGEGNGDGSCREFEMMLIW